MVKLTAYRLHQCRSPHHSTPTLARCAFPDAGSITGQGEYAVITRCGKTTISLWEQYPNAAEAFSLLTGGCGKSCVSHHELVRFALERQKGIS